MTETECDNPVRSHSERTEELRRHVLEVSVELFIEQGYDKTTTKQIAETAGILNGSLFNLFKTKEDIFSAAITEAIWRAVNGTHRFLPEASMLMRLGYPILLPIYVASKSKPLAELMSRAGKSWQTASRITDVMVKWIEENDTDGLFDTHAQGFRLKLIACLGAQAILVDKYANDPGDMDAVSTMLLAAEFLTGMFDVPTTDLRGKVEELYGIMSSGDLVIYGIRL